MSKKLLILIGIVAIAAMGSGVSANLLVQPGFERGAWLGNGGSSATGGGYGPNNYDKNATDDDGWILSTVSLANNAFDGGHVTAGQGAPVHEGTYSFGIKEWYPMPWGVPGDGMLHQIVNVDGDTSYTGSIWVNVQEAGGGVWNADPRNKMSLWMKVTNQLDNTSTTYNFDAPQTANQWLNLSGTVAVGSYPASIDMGFYFQTPLDWSSPVFGYTARPGFAFFVDDASLTPSVPEPGSLLALGSGLISLLGFGIRRRK